MATHHQDTPDRGTQGGSREPHAEAARPSHKNASSDASNSQNDGGAGNRSGKGRQGFASMDEKKQREIAAMGGRASHGGGRTAESNNGSRGGRGTQGGSSEQHAEAGRKGGRR